MSWLFICASGQISVAGDGWILTGIRRLLPTSSGRRISTSGELSIGASNVAAVVSSSRSTLQTAQGLRIRGEYGNSRLQTRRFVRRRIMQKCGCRTSSGFSRHGACGIDGRDRRRAGRQWRGCSHRWAGVGKTRCSSRRDTRGELRVPAQARVARAQQRRRVMVLKGGFDFGLVAYVEEAERWAGQLDWPE
jgi:hypothetical protein